MSKGISAMSYLPKVEIAFESGLPASVPAIKAALHKVALMQEEETADGDYDEQKCLMNQPYTSCSWSISIADGDVGGDYQVSFEDETTFQTDSLGRAALSTRRAIDFAIVPNTNEFTVRSVLAVINFIEKLEDKVASTGVSATGDGTYTAVPLRGHTPYETFVWTVVKLGAVYTLTPTANS